MPLSISETTTLKNSSGGANETKGRGGSSVGGIINANREIGMEQFQARISENADSEEHLRQGWDQDLN